MRLHLDADPAELRDQGPALLERLADGVQAHSPDLAQALRKAATPRAVPVRPLPQKSLRDLQRHLLQSYAEAMAEVSEQVCRIVEDQHEAERGR